MDKMRLATRGDLGALTSLWKTCFDDSQKYIEGFYRHRFDAIRIPVLLDGEGKVIGMVHLLPCRVYARGSMCEAFYLYAVGLAPAHRGSGAMRGFLTTVIDECTRRSFLLLLSPANARLADYYRTYGFEFAYSYEQGFFDRASLGKAHTSVRWESCDGVRYSTVRNARLAERSYVGFAPDAVDYALRENAFFGGFALTSSEGDCAFGLASEGHLLLREVCLTADGEEGRARLASLLDLFGAASCELRAPSHLIDGMQTVDAAMVYGQTDGVALGYMNLLLD